MNASCWRVFNRTLGYSPIARTCRARSGLLPPSLPERCNAGKHGWCSQGYTTYPPADPSLRPMIVMYKGERRARMGEWGAWRKG